MARIGPQLSTGSQPLAAHSEAMVPSRCEPDDKPDRSRNLDYASLTRYMAACVRATVLGSSLVFSIPGEGNRRTDKVTS